MKQRIEELKESYYYGSFLLDEQMVENGFLGHEKSRLEARPCLIVSTNEINFKSTNVIVVPLSKEIKYKHGSTTELAYNWHYILKKSKYTALKCDSAVQCEDIKCISKARMGKFITKIDADDMSEIRKRLKSTLQL